MFALFCDVSLVIQPTTMNIAFKYYLTVFDVLLCNTFISCSGFIIILVTLDRYRCICQPHLPRAPHPRLLCALALLLSLAWQAPRLFIIRVQRQCVAWQPGQWKDRIPNLLGQGYSCWTELKRQTSRRLFAEITAKLARCVQESHYLVGSTRTKQPFRQYNVPLKNV